MEFGVLGPLLARRAGGPVPLSLPSAKQRALLATLLLAKARASVGALAFRTRRAARPALASID
jgi:DNA-binding SARP family transcriptional activator